MRIHAIQTGTVAVKERQRDGRGRGRARLVRTMLDSRWTQPLPILAWLIEHPEGLILVDTGETSRAAQPGYFPAWHPYFRAGVRALVEPEMEAGQQLRALGLSPRDVRWVVLTHLHTDHAGGLDAFAGSRIFAGRTELRLAGGAGGRMRGYLPHRWPHWLAPEAVDFDGPAFGPFEASHPLTQAGDVVLIPTPGHTRGHLSVAVRTEGGLVLLAGDVSYTQSLMLEGAADGVTDDVATTRRTLERVRRLAETEPMVFLPSHDPDSVRRLDEMEAVPAQRRIVTAVAPMQTT